MNDCDAVKAVICGRILFDEAIKNLVNCLFS